MKTSFSSSSNNNNNKIGGAVHQQPRTEYNTTTTTTISSTTTFTLPATIVSRDDLLRMGLMLESQFVLNNGNVSSGTDDDDNNNNNNKKEASTTTVNKNNNSLVKTTDVLEQWLSLPTQQQQQQKDTLPSSSNHSAKENAVNGQDSIKTANYSLYADWNTVFPELDFKAIDPTTLVSLVEQVWIPIMHRLNESEGVDDGNKADAIGNTGHNDKIGKNCHDDDNDAATLATSHYYSPHHVKVNVRISCCCIQDACHRLFSLLTSFFSFSLHTTSRSIIVSHPSCWEWLLLSIRRMIPRRSKLLAAWHNASSRKAV